MIKSRMQFYAIELYPNWNKFSDYVTLKYIITYIKMFN